MKGFVKKIICFISIFGITIGTVTCAGTLVKKVYFSVYPICIDGEEYASESPILSYQGRTYVALREFSNMVGVGVNFEDNVIYLTTDEEDDDNILEASSNGASENEETSASVKVIVEDKTDSEMVYITESGTKYHSNKSCSNATTFQGVTLQEAKNRGYLPCSKCIHN